MIKFNKGHTIHMMIYENKNGTRKLYKIVHTLTGQDSKNPLLKATSDVELAEKFTESFLHKINMIRQQFDKIEAYQQIGGMYHNLKKFSTINEHDLRDTKMKILSKSCPLDILTTSLLKRVLDSCLPAITRVVNLSLDNGIYCTNLKTAVVKPLMKSTQKGTVKSNYRLVSNLPFISKAVGKCLLNKFNEIGQWHTLEHGEIAYHSSYYIRPVCSIQYCGP